MRPGDNVKAFTAARKRDKKGDTSTSQPPNPDRAALSQGRHHTSSQLFPQRQTSSQDEKANSQSQQNVIGSQMELKQHGSSPENPRQQIDHQLLDDHRQRQAEQNTLHFSRPLGVPNSDKNPKIPKINQQSVPTEQAMIPVDLLLPLLKTQLDKDRGMQLETLCNKVKKNEVSLDVFVHHMGAIFGDQMLNMEADKLREELGRNWQTGANQFLLQSQASAQPQHQKLQTVGPHQGTVPQSCAQLHQKGASLKEQPHDREVSEVGRVPRERGGTHKGVQFQTVPEEVVPLPVIPWSFMVTNRDYVNGMVEVPPPGDVIPEFPTQIPQEWSIQAYMALLGFQRLVRMLARGDTTRIQYPPVEGSSRHSEVPTDGTPQGPSESHRRGMVVESSMVSGGVHLGARRAREEGDDHEGVPACKVERHDGVAR